MTRHTSCATLNYAHLYYMPRLLAVECLYALTGLVRSEYLDSCFNDGACLEGHSHPLCTREVHPDSSTILQGLTVLQLGGGE